MILFADVRKEIESSLIEKKKIIRASIRILIFGPGEGRSESVYRSEVRKLISSKGCECLYPEEVLEGLTENTAGAEREMIYRSHLVYVLLIGIGPASEFSLYLADPAAAQGFRIFQEKKYQLAESFLNEVVKPFAEFYKQHYLFDDVEELLGLAEKCLNEYVNYHVLVDFSIGA